MAAITTFNGGGDAKWDVAAAADRNRWTAAPLGKPSKKRLSFLEDMSVKVGGGRGQNPHPLKNVSFCFGGKDVAASGQ